MKIALTNNVKPNIWSLSTSFIVIAVLVVPMIVFNWYSGSSMSLIASVVALIISSTVLFKGKLK